VGGGGEEGNGGCPSEGQSFRQRVIRSRCNVCRAAVAALRALSNTASFRKSRAFVDLIDCRFWLSFVIQVMISSVCPCGTLELARNLSHGTGTVSPANNSCLPQVTVMLMLIYTLFLTY